MIGSLFAALALAIVSIIITAKAGPIGLVLLFLAILAFGGSAASA